MGNQFRTKMKKYNLIHGKSEIELKNFLDNTFDSIITDPPYELGFMGKSWDSSGIAYDTNLWKECLRVLKPGGYMVAFSSARTYHRMACAIEDAGFEIRDQIMWIYGQGFPKSLNISKAIDRKLGAKRNVIGVKIRGENFENNLYAPAKANKNNKKVFGYGAEEVNVPKTEQANYWNGWGTALKTSHEPICLARKPISEKTVIDNILKHSTGGLNIDGCRIKYSDENPPIAQLSSGKTKLNKTTKSMFDGQSLNKSKTESTIGGTLDGRWPANVIHDGCVSRFFYCAKANKLDREEGMDTSNDHPTVKPTELMRHLCKLITPPQGLVLDPFMGSGSTGKAAMLENFNFVGIEMEKEYLNIAEKRIAYGLDVYTKRREQEFVDFF